MAENLVRMELFREMLSFFHYQMSFINTLKLLILSVIHFQKTYQNVFFLSTFFFHFQITFSAFLLTFFIEFKVNYLSKVTNRTLKKVWNICKVNNKNIRTTSMTSLWCFLANFKQIAHIFLEFLLLTWNKLMLAGNLLNC